MEIKRIINGGDIASINITEELEPSININNMEEELKELSTKIDKFEKEVDGVIHSIGSLRIDVANEFGDVNDKINDIDKRIKNINSDLTNTKELMSLILVKYKNDIQALNESNEDIFKKLRNINIGAMILLFTIIAAIILYFVI